MHYPLIVDVFVVFWLLVLVLCVITRIVDVLEREFRRPPSSNYRNYERNRKIRM